MIRVADELNFACHTPASCVEIQRIRVICLAAAATLAAISEYVGDDVRLKTDGSGQIDDGEALAIEAEVLGKVRKAVVIAPNDFATSATVRVNRSNNVASTGELKIAVSVVPRGTTNTVTATLSYSLTA